METDIGRVEWRAVPGGESAPLGRPPARDPSRSRSTRFQCPIVSMHLFQEAAHKPLAPVSLTFFGQSTTKGKESETERQLWIRLFAAAELVLSLAGGARAQDPPALTRSLRQEGHDGR